MVKIFFRCQSCGKEYDPETIPYQYGYKCDCGGYVISPSGKIQGRWEIDKKFLRELRRNGLCID